jgi:hypothetical protein
VDFTVNALLENVSQQLSEITGGDMPTVVMMPEEI